jgi:branched-subunit amino acid aminotransferase/4-amino-4-deoxychorismate lyase
VRYQRPDAHLKHLATGQAFYSRLARPNGFDDALLTAADGVISESAVANVAFFDGSGVVWAAGPLLRGITMQLLERKLPEVGLASRRAPVRLQDIASFDGAFLANARRGRRQPGGRRQPAHAGPAHEDGRRHVRGSALGRHLG